MPIIVYAIAIFALCFVSIRFLHRIVPTLLIVVLWTLLGPILMQVANYLLVGYLDPFWVWASLVLAAIALVASVAALMLCAVLERGPEVK
jgi:hypothetical protein